MQPDKKAEQIESLKVLREEYNAAFRALCFVAPANRLDTKKFHEAYYTLMDSILDL